MHSPAAWEANGLRILRGPRSAFVLKSLQCSPHAPAMRASRITRRGNYDCRTGPSSRSWPPPQPRPTTRAGRSTGGQAWEIASNGRLRVRGPNVAIDTTTITIAPAIKPNTASTPPMVRKNPTAKPEKAADSLLQE